MEGRGVKKCTFALKMKLLSDFQRLCVNSSIRVSAKSPAQHFYILVLWKLTTELMLFRCVLTVSAFLEWPIYSFHIICLFFFSPYSFPSIYLSWIPVMFHTFKFSYLKFPYSWQSILLVFMDCLLWTTSQKFVRWLHLQQSRKNGPVKIFSRIKSKQQLQKNRMKLSGETRVLNKQYFGNCFICILHPQNVTACSFKTH